MHRYLALLLPLVTGCASQPWVQETRIGAVLPGPPDATGPRIEELFTASAAAYTLSEPAQTDPFDIEVELHTPWGAETQVLPLRTCHEDGPLCETLFDDAANAVRLLDLAPTVEETIVVRYTSRMERL